LQPVFHCSLSRKVVKNHKIPVLKKKSQYNFQKDMFYEPPLPLFNNNKKIENPQYIYMYISPSFLRGHMSLGYPTFLYFYLFLEKGSKKNLSTISSNTGQPQTEFTFIDGSAS
jgi:hypothetical protein